MSHFTRRRFLEDSLLAAAATVGAGTLGASGRERLWAAEAAVGKSANERLSVAVIGVNSRGGSHLSDLTGLSTSHNLLVTHICDVDEGAGQRRAEETAKSQGGVLPKYIKDMRTLFDDSSIDAVTIATPNHWHSLAGIWAMQAGKDVYVEKPVSHNVSEGRRMVEAARYHSRICQTGTQCRSQAGSIEAIEYVKSGKIGQVKVARGLCYKGRKSIGPKGNYPVPPGVDYNLWLGPAPEKVVTRQSFHYDWHWQWDYGNGDLGNQGIHQMDVARWGLGVKTLSSHCLSYGGRLGYEDAGETANTQVVIHDYGTSSLVFEVRGLPTDSLKDAHVGVIFEGTDGYVVLNSYDAGMAFDRAGQEIRKFQGVGDHMANFIAAVRSRKVEDLNAEIEEGHLSSALCHLGNISYLLGSRIPLPEAQSRLQGNPERVETFERFQQHLADNGLVPDQTQLQFGQELTIDPVREQFVNNPEADVLLTREYRSPFVVPAAGQV